MNINKWIVLLGAFLMIGCGPTATPPVAIPVAPEKTESVQPALKKVKEGINESVKSNEKFDDKIREQAQAVSSQNLEIGEALVQAEKIKEKVLAQQIITELEAINLINQLNKVQVRNLFLEKTVAELEKIRKDQLLTLKKAYENAQDAEMKLIMKEDEAVKLRNHSQFLATNLQSKNKEVVSLQKALTKEKIHAAKSTVYKNWIWILVGSFVAWTIIKNVISLYSPVKFRI